MQIVGKTLDGKLVVNGVFGLYAESGLPIEDMVSFLMSKSMVIDWIDFCVSAIKNGWKHKTILSKISTLDQVYSKKDIDNITYRIKFYFDKIGAKYE